MEVKYVHETSVHNTKAAEQIVPTLLSKYSIKSVIDVGCGIGTWLTVFEKYNIEYLGIDGDYVDRKLMLIDEKRFINFDLNNEFSLDQKFDLVLCLEVAEHLESQSAPKFVECLCNLSNLIIFSAAIPGQGGQNHLNEQYPGYWLSLFEKFGYYLIDDIRPIFWNNKNIEWWYKQNILVLKKNPIEIEKKELVFQIHPDLYKIKNLEIELLKNNIKNIMDGHISLTVAMKIFVKSILYLIYKKNKG